MPEHAVVPEHKATGGASARRTIFTYPTYLRQPARRLPPIFMPHNTAYPDTLDDMLGGPRREVEYDAIILENEHLRLTILPDLAGKLFSVFDKNAGREATHVPDVIKPGLIQRSGAWVPGGMEFNFPVGHYIRGTRPALCSIAGEGPDVATAVVHRRCNRTGLCLDVRISLARGEARFRIDYAAYNPTLLPHRWYMWNNVGVTASAQWRFFCKAVYLTTGFHVHSYPIDEQGVDASYSRNRPIGSDSFMIAHREDWFGCYDYGTRHGLAHVGPWQEMAGKKYFTWGWTYRDFSDDVAFSDSGQIYNEIQSGPLETQMDFAMLAPGETVRFHENWLPYRQIGGIEWANRDLLFMVQDGRPWAYAARDLELGLSVDGRQVRQAMRAGQAAKLDALVKDGSRIEITIDGQLARAFAYPLKGEQEPGGVERARARFHGRPPVQPKTAQQHLERAQWCILRDMQYRAAEHLRAALKQQPASHAARLSLAQTLWRMGDFEAGLKELARLERTELKEAARQMRVRLPAIQEAFMAPVLAVAEGPARQLALAERLAGYGSYEKAAAIYRVLAVLDPHNPRVHYGLARYYQHVKHDLASAVSHADQALELLPGDRDMTVELAPVLAQAAAWPRVLEVLADLPRDAQSLHVVLKLAAKAYFELGRYDECWRIVSRRLIHIWEGEWGHIDTYIDCAIALAEEALRQGQLAEAEKFAQAAGELPPTLGMPHRRSDTCRHGWWRGLCQLKRGRPEEARRTWQAAVARFLDEYRVLREVYASNWWTRATDEQVYHADLCRLTLEGKLPEPLFCRIMRDDRQAWSFGQEQPYLDGCLAELRGDFAQARRHFEKALKSPPEKRLTLLHLETVKARRRRGEL